MTVVSDSFHEVAQTYYMDLLSRHVRLFTSNYVLDEIITRIRYDIGPAEACRFCELYEEAEERQLVTTLWVDETVAQEALKIFRRYSDQRFSLTDCTSFFLMQRHSLKEAFTFDTHFEAFGASRRSHDRNDFIPVSSSTSRRQTCRSSSVSSPHLAHPVAELQEETLLSWRQHPVDDVVLALLGYLTGLSFLKRHRWSHKAWLQVRGKVSNRRTNLIQVALQGRPVVGRELQDSRLPSTPEHLEGLVPVDAEPVAT